MILSVQVKVLYVRNLKAEVTEEELKECFEPYGKIERVKKIKDYGFVHFEEREAAIKALEELNGKVSAFTGPKCCVFHYIARGGGARERNCKTKVYYYYISLV